MIVAGDPLERYVAGAEKKQVQLEHYEHVFSATDRSWSIPGPYPNHRYRSDNTVLDVVLMFATNEEFGIYFLFIWPIVGWYAVRRRRQTWELLVWVGALALLLAFFPVVFPRYTLPRDPRYYLCISAPAILCLSHALLEASRMWRGIAVGLLLTSSVVGLHLTQHGRSQANERELYAFHSKHPDEPLWTTPKSATHLFVYSGFRHDSNLKVHFFEQSARSDNWQVLRLVGPGIETVEKPDKIRDGYVAVRKGLAEGTPESWKRVLRISNRPPASVRLFQDVLKRLGVPRKFIDRVSPSGANEIEVYHVGVRPP